MAIPRNLGNLASGADSNGVLGVTKGGTGATSNATAPFALKGANADITSLTGLTTALSPANGGTGLTSPGSSGNVLTSNGTAWTSAAAAPGAGTLTAVATGSLSNGSTVIVNSDGTVSVVATTVLNPPTIGSLSVFEAASTTLTSVVYVSSSDKIVVAYRDAGNSQFGTAIVGTVFGSTITFGTPVVFESANSNIISAVYDSTNDKVVIAYADVGNSSFGTAIVGTVSETSISFGTAVVFASVATAAIASVFDSVNSKVVICFCPSSGERGTAIVGTVSGTSISFGSSVIFQNTVTSRLSATFDSTNGKVVPSYRNEGSSNHGTAIVGTVSGTSISFGTAVVFEAATTEVITSTFDTLNGKVVIAYRDDGNSNFGTAIVGTVSGTSISFGTAVVYTTATIGRQSIVYDSVSNKVTISGNIMASSRMGAITGTVSGTSISFGTAVAIGVNTTDAFSSAFVPLPTNRVIITFQAPTDFGTAVTLANQGTTLTTENYIGISNAAYTNGQTATIQIVGSVDDAQSGLVAGQSYFIQNDGALALSPVEPSVFAGTAVSATRLIVKG